MITSNLLNTWLIKNMLMIFGTMLLMVSTFSLYQPIEVQLNEFEYYKTNLFDGIILLCIGLICILIHLIYSKLVVGVSLNNQVIVIKGQEYHWADVKSINRVWFVRPMCYRLKLREDDQLYIFTTEGLRGRYFSFETPEFVIAWDLSAMGKVIRKVKKAYKI